MSKKAADKKGGDKKGEKTAKGPVVPSLLEHDDEGFSNFSRQDDTTNLTLFVDGRKMFVHRDVLNVNCPGLRPKLMGYDEEGGADGEEHAGRGGGADADYYDDRGPTSPRSGASAPPAEITLEDKNPEHILELLKCLYPPHKPITDANVNELLPLVGEYEIASLSEQCEQVLMEREHSVKLLLQAQQAKLDAVVDAVSTGLTAERSLAELQKQEGYDQLDSSTRAVLYRKRILFLEGEQDRLQDTAQLIYGLTRCVVKTHKCSSVDDERFGYLVITTTEGEGKQQKKRRQTHPDSALVHHNEINPKCKECVYTYGADCYSELKQLEEQGAFDHLKKKFEQEKKPKAKPGKK